MEVLKGFNWIIKESCGIVLTERERYKSMEKPVIKYKSHGETGNIFFILAMVRDELRKQRRINDYNELWSKVQLSKSYEEALGYIREVVTLIDEDNKNV